MKPFSFRAFIRKYFFNPHWRCAACGREIFGDEYFCADCEKALPVADGNICAHCGRKTDVPEDYCRSCKNRLTAIDKGRSAFFYDKPVSDLILKSKYGGGRYLLDMFAEYLAAVYFKNYFSADIICYVPMTEKAERKRGYNHSKLIALKFSELTGVKVGHCISKIKDTERQAKLTGRERAVNLAGSFRVTDKAAVRGKAVLLVDDVTTTGATAQEIGSVLKTAGAKTVYLITVASVPEVHKTQEKKDQARKNRV